MAARQGRNRKEAVLDTSDGKRLSAAARDRRLRQVVIPYLFLLPFLVLFFAFLVLPLAYALGISVFADRLVGGTVFIGAENYLRAIRDPAFLGGPSRYRSCSASPSS